MPFLSLFSVRNCQSRSSGQWLSVCSERTSACVFAVVLLMSFHLIILHVGVYVLFALWCLLFVLCLKLTHSWALHFIKSQLDVSLTGRSHVFSAAAGVAGTGVVAESAELWWNPPSSIGWWFCWCSSTHSRYHPSIITRPTGSQRSRVRNTQHTLTETNVALHTGGSDSSSSNKLNTVQE